MVLDKILNYLCLPSQTRMSLNAMFTIVVAVRETKLLPSISYYKIIVKSGRDTGRE